MYIFGPSPPIFLSWTPPKKNLLWPRKKREKGTPYPWYRCYYPRRSRDSVSPVCGIKKNIFDMQLNAVESYFQRQTDRQTDIQIYRQWEKQTDRQTDRQKDGQTERQKVFQCLELFWRPDCTLPLHTHTDIATYRHNWAKGLLSENLWLSVHVVTITNGVGLVGQLVWSAHFSLEKIFLTLYVHSSLTNV